MKSAIRRIHTPIAVIIAVLLISLAATVLSACQSGQEEERVEGTPVPETEFPHPEREATYDDIIFAPGGGMDYRTNGFQKDVANVATTDIILTSGSHQARITYREFIKTEAGVFRTNIIRVKDTDEEVEDLSLYAVDVPDVFSLAYCREVIEFGAPATVLVITISPDTSAGQYEFEIGLEINGKDYGTMPCTIEVFGD